jgi:hypothetical protein
MVAKKCQKVKRPALLAEQGWPCTSGVVRHGQAGFGLLPIQSGFHSARR